MAPPCPTALLLLLLLLGHRRRRPPQHPEPHPPGTPLTHLRGYLGHAGELLGHLSLPRATQRLQDAYERGSLAVMTYTGIFTDQLYHWWQGEQ